MSELVVSQIEYGSAAYRAAVALRDELLRRPLGLRLTDQELEQDRQYPHFVCEADGEIVGCLMLAPLSDTDVRVRQVAVAQHAQRRGVGRAMTDFAEAFARRAGFTRMILHSRESAVPFYQKMGYERVGEFFEEVTVPHCEMRKELVCGSTGR
jgi:predicted GNAT family N-acyltransferase